jgi:hypothetical protein
MTDRTATCVCGGLTVDTLGEPIKVSACHCLSCQRRTGSAFSVAVFFDRANVAVHGAWRSFDRIGDSGRSVDFRFCPRCGSTVLWYPQFRPSWAGVAIGCFNDRSLQPSQAVYEPCRQSWIDIQLAEV